ncbi:MAG: hypothetical protein ABEI78_02000 [Candidatus Nanohaloarchaea archaeon]
MKLKAFSNLKKNQGDSLDNLEVYRVGINKDEYAYDYILSSLPEETACTIYKGYAWICWTEKKENPKKVLEENISSEDAFTGEVISRSLNIISDQCWKPIGIDLLKSAFYNKAYSSGPYFKDKSSSSKTRLCHAKALDEKEGRQLFCAIRLKLYRNKKKDNFYFSLDPESNIERKENPPKPWKDDSYVFYHELKPDSSERLERTSGFLEPMQDDDGKIELRLNDKEIILSNYLEMPEEVETV